MRSSLLVTLRTLARTPSALIWILAFPVILSCVFMFMFSAMRTDGAVEAVPVAVVADDAWDASAFSEVVDALDAGGEKDAASGEKDAEPAAASDAPADETRLLDVRRVGTADDARVLLAAGEVDGWWEVGADGAPRLTVGSAYTTSDPSGGSAVNRSILEAVTSSYASRVALVGELAREDPAALADAAAVARALGLSTSVARTQVTHGLPDETVRYHYALLGMSALMASQAGMLAVALAQPGVSALGARRAVSGTSRARQLAGCVLGAWAFSFACLTVAFLFLRLVVGVDFAGREGLCLAGVAVSSLLSTAIGALVGALPLRAGIDARAGILTAASCVLSLFAGLYGTAAMELSDWLARTAPWTAWANPARLVCDVFYALYYYTSLAPFAARLAACALVAAALLGAAALLFRRQSHEHL